MKRIREEHVREQASTSVPLVILDGQVVDLSGFLEHHPGGPAVLLANLGRDVSLDFHHVTAHARPAVARELGRRVIGEVERDDLPPALQAFSGLLDYVRLLVNSFEAQFDPERDPMSDLIYVGQLYCHFVADHLCSFLSTLSGLAGRSVDSMALSHLREIFEAVLSQVEEVTAAVDRSAATVLSGRMRWRCGALLNDLLAIGADATEAVRGSENKKAFSTYLEKALYTINKWIGDEHDVIAIK